MIGDAGPAVVVAGVRAETLTAAFLIKSRLVTMQVASFFVVAVMFAPMHIARPGHWCSIS